ncbi:MAG TPA: type IV pilin [Methanocorpusculum sp.]|uniref:type IV pilin n=1 Tax=Methanocorpusculum sp. TaxID=2058474 RepID=UPI0029965F37|nr:type IV pilin [Methanocorpusculum sp.]MEA5085903.1 type IV pilin [Methanocorpusculum sp.]HJJ35120.1 type IV pilin [Methanocorpusculum sp.]
MKQRSSNKGDDGVSPVIATLLLIALTLIICAIVFACLMNYCYTSSGQFSEDPPEILAIVSVDHYNDKGKLTFASNVTLRNIGTKSLWNSDYRAEIYINDTKQFIVIDTLKADEFISTHHYGIKNLFGSGPIGYEWEAGNSGVLDLEDGKIHPGDLLRIDIINNNASSPSFSKVISRSIKLIE